MSKTDRLLALRAEVDALAKSHSDPHYRAHLREQAARLTGELAMLRAHKHLREG